MDGCHSDDVREIPPAIIKKLDLRASAEAEAKWWRNLLPPEPWTEQVAAQPGHFANWVSNRLRAGHRNAPGFG
jgi:hypothetical protein